MANFAQPTLSKQNLSSIKKAKEFLQLEIDVNPRYSIYGTDENLVMIIKELDNILKKFNYFNEKKRR